MKHAFPDDVLERLSKMGPMQVCYNLKRSIDGTGDVLSIDDESFMVRYLKLYQEQWKQPTYQDSERSVRTRALKDVDDALWRLITLTVNMVQDIRLEEAEQAVEHRFEV